MAHRLAPEAEADLDDIWWYVVKESGSAEVADRLIDSITARFLVLGDNPYLGRSRDDLRHGLWSFPIRQYVVIYRVESSRDVVILHVVRGSRDIGGLLGH